jgi:hypothetical protein
MAKKTIKLKCYGEDITLNLVANAAITPGMIVEQLSTDKVQAHASAGQNVAPVLVAMENDLEGEAITDAYAADDQVRCWIPRRGDEAYLWLEDGQNVNKHDLLESAGTGRLQKHAADVESFESAETGSITVYPNQVVAEALESKDLSSSSADESSGLQGDRRIKVRFI